MEPEKNEIKSKNPAKTKSPIDNVETPTPAQEIYPLQQSMNDGKHKGNNVPKNRKNGRK